MLIFYFILGLIVLSLGAEIFVRGASTLAAMFGISPLIIGLTVVAFGTSAPEVAVAMQAGFQGQGDLAFGNIVGSNISNFLLILGISAILSPLVVSKRLVRLEVPLLLGVSVAVIVLGWDGMITTMEGFVLVSAAAAYTYLVIRSCRLEDQAAAAGSKQAESSMDEREKEQEKPRHQRLKSIAMLVLGLGGLVLGANWLVSGASGLARLIGISELVIGLTIVAVGTSLPELATSVAASIRGERDLAIGNIIGSNLFNLLFVLGLAVVVVPKGLPVPSSALAFDLPVMLGVTAASLPIFYSGYNITRREGLLFLAYYAAYILYLLLFSAEHDLLPAYSTLMLRYIIPLTGLLLLFIGIKAIRTRKIST